MHSVSCVREYLRNERRVCQCPLVLSRFMELYGRSVKCIRESGVKTDRNIYTQIAQLRAWKQRRTGGQENSFPSPIRPLRFLSAASLPAFPPLFPFCPPAHPALPRTAGQLLLVVHPLLQYYDLLSCWVCAVLCIYAREFVHVRRVIVHMLSLSFSLPRVRVTK